MADYYIRPPIVAREAPSRQAAIWRFRLYVVVAVAVFVVAMFLIFKAITGNANDNPGIGQTLAPAGYFFAGNVRA